MATATAEILRRPSEDETINLAACDGSKTISASKAIFTRYIDPDLLRWGADDPTDDTPAGPVQVYELAENATFQEIFESLSDDLDSLCLTGAQIHEFCQTHRDKLKGEEYSIFFLKKSRGKLFVVRVSVYVGALGVRVTPFASNRVWNCRCRHRVVVPKLA